MCAYISTLKSNQLKAIQYTQEEFPIMEAFYTIQGEGFNSGVAAYFIRIAGCDVGCSWCDVKESWTTEGHSIRTVDELVQGALEFPARTVVITGGEPLMYPLDKLTEALSQAGFRICLETSGAHPLTGLWHWICLSPKKFLRPLEGMHQEAHELKMIIYNKNDFKWAEEHAALVTSNCKLYLQPEWSKMETMLPVLIEYVKANPKWQISLQTHKYMQIP